MSGEDEVELGEDEEDVLDEDTWDDDDPGDGF